MITAENMVRVGVVSDINANAKTARVIFPDSGNLVSGWLYVLQFPGITMNSAGGHNHSYSEGTTGWGGGHTHTLTGWMPAVKDRVLCLMMCGSETDGYILGAIP